ncbi:hypothetical protein ACJW31_02G084600 [Castanea mollissima]
MSIGQRDGTIHINGVEAHRRRFPNLGYPWCKISIAKFGISLLIPKILIGQSSYILQTLLAMLHLKIAWTVDSTSLLHSGHMRFTWIPLLFIFSIVGIASIHNLHTKILTFAGIFRCHIFFHSGISILFCWFKIGRRTS